MSTLTEAVKSFKPSDQVPRIIECLRLRRAGRDPSDLSWQVFQLAPGDFEWLIKSLKTDEELWGFVEDKVHYDYFSRSRRFVLRRTTRLLGFVCSQLVFKIQAQLSAIANSTSDAADYAKNIYLGGSPTMEFPSDLPKDKYDVHTPDGTFRYKNMLWPRVIIEISYSMKRKDLQYLAEDYILGSNGNVHVVIGLDVEYKNSPMATISVWRPEYQVDQDGQEWLASIQTISDQLFRDELGNPVGDSTTGLDLTLKDFSDETAVDQPIFIASSVLYDILQRAETSNKGTEMMYLKPGTRKRRRPRTPPEEL